MVLFFSFFRAFRAGIKKRAAMRGSKTVIFAFYARTRTRQGEFMSKSKSGRNEQGQFTAGNNYASGNNSKRKYSEEYCEKIIKFFDVTPTKTVYVERYDENGDVVEREPVVVANDYRTFESFARSIGVTLRALEIWKNKYKRFRAAWEAAEELQRNMLIVNGLHGKYNASFAKFIAVNHHGMSDKHEQKLEGGEGLDINITVTDKV